MLATGISMPVSKRLRHDDYVRYANHCLEMVRIAETQEDRSLLREMAAEWLRLADELDRPE